MWRVHILTILCQNQCLGVSCNSSDCNEKTFHINRMSALNQSSFLLKNLYHSSTFEKPLKVLKSWDRTSIFKSFIESYLYSSLKTLIPKSECHSWKCKLYFTDSTVSTHNFSVSSSILKRKKLFHANILLSLYK